MMYISLIGLALRGNVVASHFSALAVGVCFQYAIPFSGGRTGVLELNQVPLFTSGLRKKYLNHLAHQLMI